MRELFAQGRLYFDGLQNSDNLLEGNFHGFMEAFAHQGNAQWRIEENELEELKPKQAVEHLIFADQDRVLGKIYVTTCGYGYKDARQPNDKYNAAQSTLTVNLDADTEGDLYLTEVLSTIARKTEENRYMFIEIHLSANELQVQYSERRFAAINEADIRSQALSSISAVLARHGVQTSVDDWSVRVFEKRKF